MKNEEKIFLHSGKYKISYTQGKHPINMFFLKNGLKIIHLNTKSKASLISITFRAGLFSENINKVGISHFLEHIIFNSTLNQSREKIAETIENLGGELNGSTSDFTTMYYIKIAKQHFGVACNILSDMIINPAFDEKELEFERSVIINEIKNDYDDEINYSQNLMRETYFKNSIWQYTPAGSVDSVSSLTKEDLQDYYKANYSAKNAFIIILGKFSQDELKMVLKVFEPLRKGEKSNAMDFSEKFPLTSSSDIENSKKRTQSHFLLSYKTTFPNHNDQYALTILQNILYKGLSGRIVKAIRNEKGLAYSISVSNDNSSFQGIFFIYVVVEKRNVEKAKQIILREIHKLSEFGDGGISEEELRNAKTSILGNKALYEETITARHTYLFWSELFDDYTIFYDFEKNISKVSLADINSIISKYFENYLSILLS